MRAVRPLAATLLVAGAAWSSACATGEALRRPQAFPGAPTALSIDPQRRTVFTDAVVAAALTLRGVNYRLGGEDPATGFDCSGLVRYVFQEESIDLPRTVVQQFEKGSHPRRADIEPGDLLFFATESSGPSHVGIAIDGSSFVHAPGEGRVVRVERFDTPYWQTRFVGVRRVSPD
jgi:cell wall-associated NlpC family hydrolase